MLLLCNKRLFLPLYTQRMVATLQKWPNFNDNLDLVTSNKICDEVEDRFVAVEDGVLPVVLRSVIPLECIALLVL